VRSAFCSDDESSHKEHKKKNNGRKKAQEAQKERKAQKEATRDLYSRIFAPFALFCGYISSPSSMRSLRLVFLVQP
jgi:hypothetical protein